MKKFIIFLCVGGSATALQYGIMILLVQFFHQNPVLATSIGYVISSILNYVLNYYATFNSKAHHLTATLKFSVVASLGLIINSSVVYLLTMAKWHYLLAQLVATIIVLLWNFFMHKIWTYKSNSRHDVNRQQENHS